jgi:hypothetical protein
MGGGYGTHRDVPVRREYASWGEAQSNRRVLSQRGSAAASGAHTRAGVKTRAGSVAGFGMRRPLAAYPGLAGTLPSQFPCEAPIRRSGRFDFRRRAVRRLLT